MALMSNPTCAIWIQLFDSFLIKFNSLFHAVYLIPVTFYELYDKDNISWVNQE